MSGFSESQQLTTSPVTIALEEILTQLRHLPPDSRSFPAIGQLTALLGASDFAEVVLFIQKTEHSEFAVDFLSKCDRIEGAALSLVASSKLPDVLQICVANTADRKLATTVLDLVISSFAVTKDRLVMSEEVAGIVFTAAMDAIPSTDIALSEHGCKLAEKIVLAVHERVRSQLLTSMLSVAERHSCGDRSLFMRFANVWARILGTNNEAFEACEESGAVREIVSLCQNKEDVLVQMVALELLPFFSRTTAGVRYLLSSGVVGWLLQLSGTAEGEGDPFMGAQAIRMLGDIFCHPDLRVTNSSSSGSSGVGSLIGSVSQPAGTMARSSIASSSYVSATTTTTTTTAAATDVSIQELWGLQDGSHSELFKKYLAAILLRIQSRDESDRLAGLVAISNFASSCNAALTLTVAAEQEELLDSWFSLLNSAKAEMQASVLHAVARVVGSTCNEQEHVAASGASAAATAAGGSSGSDASSSSSSSSSSAVQDAKKGLLHRIGSTKRSPVVEYLVKCARMPSHELKEAAYALMTAMCKRPGGWGLLALLSAPGFKEFLGDQNTEHFKEGREWKFSVIVAISECDQLSALYSADIVASIHKLVSQGPHYRPPRMEELLTIER